MRIYGSEGDPMERRTFLKTTLGASTAAALGLAPRPVHAEWPAGEKTPVIEITSRFAARDRAVDLSRPPVKAVREDRAVLARYLEPTKLIPTDGVVLETAQGITQGIASDADKARALYEWIVENTFRDPKVRGCGLADIRSEE